MPGQRAAWPPGLADRAVVGFLVRIADALDFLAAPWARQTEAPVHRHIGTKRGDLLGEISCRLRPVHAIHSTGARWPGWRRRACATRRASIFCVKLIGDELSRVQDFIRVCVADAAQDARIRERALQRTIFGGQCGAKLLQRTCEHVDAARIERLQRRGPAHHMNRGAPLGAGFGQQQRAAVEVPNAARVLRPPNLAPAARQCNLPAIIR